MRKIRNVLLFIMTAVFLTGCAENPYKSGVNALEDGDYSKAAEEFMTAIEKEKNLADSYRGLGISLWEQGTYEDALKAFESAISEGTKESATIYSLMGNCSMQVSKYDKAAEYYEMALTMKDISEELVQEVEYNLIAAYEYAGELEQAKEQVSKYVEKYPDEEAALREAGFLETR